MLSRRIVRPGDEIAVAAFLTLTFALAWLPFLAQAAGLGKVGTVLMPVAPAIACVVVRRWVTREGFGDAGLRPRPRHWDVYLVALIWPVGAEVCVVIVARALRLGPSAGVSLGTASPHWSTLASWAGASILVTPVILGEELGWRGYLQLRLFPTRPLTSALATGFVWGIWHYPLILSSGEPTDNTSLTLVALPISTMSFSVFLGWVRSVSESVWATSLAHASNNVTNDNLQRTVFTGNQDGHLPDVAIVPSLIGEALVWGAVVVAHTLRTSHVKRDVD